MKALVIERKGCGPIAIVEKKVPLPCPRRAVPSLWHLTQIPDKDKEGMAPELQPLIVAGKQVEGGN